MKTWKEDEDFPRGADLECHLFADGLVSDDLSRILTAAEKQGFSVGSETTFLVYGADPIAPVQTPGILERAVEALRSAESSAQRCVVALTGQFAGHEITASLTVDLTNRVVSVSIPEGWLWYPSRDPRDLKYERIAVIGAVSKRIAETIGASVAWMGSESITPKELAQRSGDVAGAGPPDAILSEIGLRGLAQWYRLKYPTSDR